LLPDFRVRQRDYLLEISRSITQELDLGRVLERILNVSIEMLAGQAGLIALREEPGGWNIAVAQGIPPSFLQQLDPLLAEVPEAEEATLEELAEVNRLLQSVTYSASMGLLSGVVLPLIARRRVIGVIFIFRNYPGIFSTNDKALLQSFANQAAVAVSNAQLYSQASNEKQRMGALLDSTADGILILRPDHTIERCNPALARMLGTTIENIINRKHAEVIRFSKYSEGARLEQAEVDGWPLTPNATLYVEGDLERPGGYPLPVGITYASLVSAQGNLLNIIASLRDITRFREAEELKSTFISVISHELKTPVALIKGYVGTLLREDMSWDEATSREFLQIIEEEADHLANLIENLLDASRLQAGVLSINLAEVALDDLVKGIAERFRTQTSIHEFEIDFPDNFPIILGDIDRLTQVLSNLFSNAIKYSPNGGEIRVVGQVLGNQVVVCVSDQGAGIAPDDIPHVFDRFYRAKEASRTTKGTGLGLYLAKAVVEAHHGRIWVDPRPGDGARICFSLPREAKF
jgi:PAS domain S-box-containing protein